MSNLKNSERDAADAPESDIREEKQGSVFVPYVVDKKAMRQALLDSASRFDQDCWKYFA